MTTITDKLRVRLFPPASHPYSILEREIEGIVRPDDTLLDAGCGRSAELIELFAAKVHRAIGIDLLDSVAVVSSNCRYIRTDLSSTGLPDNSVDVAVSRSVMEHLDEPLVVYKELFRVLKPGGRFVFLTPNLWDYSSILSKLIPNRFHGFIVARTEGRREEDTFPTRYLSNTPSRIRKLSGESGFDLMTCQYLNQYPNYLRFNVVLFLIGSAYAKFIERIPWLAFLKPWLLVILQKPAQPANDLKERKLWSACQWTS
jgi:SAM-dependent methyltransferase